MLLRVTWEDIPWLSCLFKNKNKRKKNHINYTSGTSEQQTQSWVYIAVFNDIIHLKQADFPKICDDWFCGKKREAVVTFKGWKYGDLILSSQNKFGPWAKAKPA